ncbi:MAG: FAD-binding protein, partial [Ornithinimicrobium sp.]
MVLTSSTTGSASRDLVLADLARHLRSHLPPDSVITDHTQLRTYECDGITGYRVLPALVALPRSTAEVALVVAACAESHVPFVARGAGTGLSGGAVPVLGGVVISLARMRGVG